MFKHIVLHAVRTLQKQKVFSAINILGLSTGLMAFVLIVLYVRFEFSFDDFHKDANKIYRVTTRVTLEDEIINQESSTYEGIIRTLREDFPVVEEMTVISAFDSDGTLVRFKNSRGKTESLTNYKGFYADESFFKVFSFPMVNCDPATVLKEPYSAVISRALSSAYFENDPVGKVLEFTDDDETPKRLTIAGVMEGVPANSHLQFDLIINIPQGEESFWTWGGHPYLKLGTLTDPETLEHRLDALAKEKNGLKIDKDDYGHVSTFKLQKLADIHLYSDLEYEFERGTSSLLVYSLLFLAFLILTIAWINYITLYTAFSFQKIRQIGIRKIVGASRASLRAQILMDSAMFNFLSIAIAGLSAWILLPSFNEFVGVPTGAITLTDPELWAAAVLFLLISSLVSGGYPACLIATLKPVTAMKGGTEKLNDLAARQYLVIFQFAIATMFIITATIVHKQLSFMLSKDLGINTEQILVIKAMNFEQETWSDSAGGYIVDPAYRRQAQLFKNDLFSLTTIKHTTALSHLPGQVPNWGTEFRAQDIDPAKALNLKAVGIDYDFIPTMGVSLLAGRNFSPDFPSDRGNENKRAVIINETASELLGFRSPKEAVSRHITTYWGADYEIIGVVNSFHQVSPRDNLTPLYFVLQPRALSYFAVNFKTNDLSQTIADIRSRWSRHFPDYPFHHFFLDDYFNRQYDGEVKLAEATRLSTILAVFIACMGLFGFTSYAIVHRSKEIGIRKVLGASASNVIALFSVDFMKLILIGTCIATPVTFYLIVQWLNNYAYSISLEWWLFVLPASAILGIVMITIGLQTMKIALKNPVESLKHE